MVDPVSPSHLVASGAPMQKRRGGDLRPVFGTAPFARPTLDLASSRIRAANWAVQIFANFRRSPPGSQRIEDYEATGEAFADLQ